MTYAEGKKLLQAARRAAQHAYDSVCRGSTCPPPSMYAPELVRLERAAEDLLELYARLEDEGRDMNAQTLPALADETRARADAVTHEAARVVGAAKDEDRRNRAMLGSLELVAIMGGLYWIERRRR